MNTGISEGFPGLLGLGIIVMTTVTIFMVAVVIWSAVQNRRQPVRRVRAVILRKRTREASLDIPTNPFWYIIATLGRGIGRRRPDYGALGRMSGEETITLSMDCLVTFGVGGEEVELVVPQGLYIGLEEGRQGTLIYQGEIFKHFMADVPQHS